MNPYIKSGILYIGTVRILLRQVCSYDNGPNPASVIVYMVDRQVSFNVGAPNVAPLLAALDAHFSEVWDNARNLINDGLGTGGRIAGALRANAPTQG